MILTTDSLKGRFCRIVQHEAAGLSAALILLGKRLRNIAVRRGATAPADFEPPKGLGIGLGLGQVSLGPRARFSI